MDDNEVWVHGSHYENEGYRRLAWDLLAQHHASFQGPYNWDYVREEMEIELESLIKEVEAGNDEG